MRKYLILFQLLFCGVLTAQILTESHLPIVIITTDNAVDIPDDPRVYGTMKIIRNNGNVLNNISQANSPGSLHYNGRISIETRGSSSQALEKKGYGITTLQPGDVENNNVAMFGMPRENDWVLNGLAFDPSLIRDYLSYNLSAAIGQYAPRTQFCEVIINGDYRGIYLFQEKIKADEGRVNVMKILPFDSAGEALTGGYITKADKTTGNDPVAWTMASYAVTTDFIHDMPKPEEVTSQQNLYIRSRFMSLAADAQNNDFTIQTGYPSVIDVPTFIDFMIINEIAANVDAYQLSTFFHQDRNGKLRAGPVWDHNLTYGNDLFMWGYDRSHVDVWQFDNGDNTGPKFWRDLFEDDIFNCLLAKRYNQLSTAEAPLSLNQIYDRIDAAVDLLGDAIERENQRWGTVSAHQEAIAEMKEWLSLRVEWMSQQLADFTACTDIDMPPLVISAINYNPAESAAFPESNDSEFIELTNAGSEEINLSGVYFSQLGISYVFPWNSVIAPGAKIYLASSPGTFTQRYGLPAFGKFTRNLSNKSQNLVLADAFGNVIDSVQYLDDAPWPDADGNGSYLQLADLSFDNALASSWIAQPESTLSTNDMNYQQVRVFPNPTQDKIEITGMPEESTIGIYDLSGRLIHTVQGQHADLSDVAPGTYLLKIKTDRAEIVRKIIRL